MIVRPIIPESLIVRHKGNVYKGKILEGKVFAWKPDDPYARELIIVTKTESGDRPLIYAMNLDNPDKEYWNDEDHFRESVYGTMFKIMSNPNEWNKIKRELPWPTIT